MKVVTALSALGVGAVLMLGFLWMTGRAEREAVVMPSATVAAAAPGQPVTVPQQTLARGAASVPSAASSGAHAPGEAKESFESAADLYALAVRAAGATDPWLLVHGFEAAKVCIAAKADWDVIAPRLQEHLSGALAGRQRISANALQSRCLGFLNNDRAGNNSIRSRMREQAQLNQNLYLGGTSDPPISQRQFAYALQSNNWASAIAAMHDILERTLKAQRIDPKGADAAVFGFAYLASMCDVGRDCSGSGTSYHYACARFGSCAGSLLDEHVAQAGAIDGAKFARYRLQITSAWRAADAAFFGFGK